MKKTIKTFLTVGKILDIVCITLFSFLALILFMLAAFSGLVEDEVTKGVLIGTSVGTGFSCLFVVAIAIVSLVLNSKSTSIFVNATTKQEVNKAATLAIISGALLSSFPIASGIMMFCLKPENI